MLTLTENPVKTWHAATENNVHQPQTTILSQINMENVPAKFIWNNKMDDSTKKSQVFHQLPGQIIRTSDTDTGPARFRLSITKSSTIPLADQVCCSLPKKCDEKNDILWPLQGCVVKNSLKKNGGLKTYVTISDHYKD